VILTLIYVDTVEVPLTIQQSIYLPEAIMILVVSSIHVKGNTVSDIVNPKLSVNTLSIPSVVGYSIQT